LLPWERKEYVLPKSSEHPKANSFATAAGYNTAGERLVAGVVPLSEDLNYVLLIQSTRRKGWVLPKGGWESDETCDQAASREAWEEAGISVQIDYTLDNIEEKRQQKSSKERARYYFYQATVLEQFEEWPEKHKRERKWFTYTQALDALATRPELQEALNRSTINRL
jgi:diphosphoinositol-polyphosphate diphosphatase